ncbi:hypothetical protein [Pseudomonas sp.]|uniref:hypothetical protein n=1 Tax=Pseudomonas sp. TaxID=306 RepID=UPI003C656DF4
MNINSLVHSAVPANTPSSASTQAPASDNPFKSLSNKGMATYLSNNFSKFVDPNKPGVVTRESLHAIAHGSPQEGADAHFSRFALALLGNPGLMEQLARSGDIDRPSVSAYIKPQNGRFSGLSDLSLTWHLLNKFSTFSKPYEFVTGRNASEMENVVTRETLQAVKSSDASSRYTDEDRMFASELLSRKSLTGKVLDGLGGSGFQNMISHTVLDEWLTLGNRTWI